MTILILNWRDIKNPTGGGAEILTHEMAKRWVKSGNQVIQFCSNFAGGKKEETIDGVTFIRRGKWWTVHLLAIFYYVENRKKFDVIVDEVHWFPFFALLYAPHKTIAFTCEVANQMLYRILPYPAALFFRGIEKVYLRLYRKVPTMVISPSTYNDLVSAGHEKKSIIVLPMGFSVPKRIKKLPKEKVTTIISVGRLNKQKGTLDVLEAFTHIKKKLPKSQLWLVGPGDAAFFTSLVKQFIITHELGNSVTLWGFVSETEKFNLLSRAHVLVSASMQEGFGLTIPEAGLMKTPSVVYNTQGFCDIIDQNKDGILTQKNPRDLAKSVVLLISSQEKYTKIQEGAYKKSLTYSWDQTAETSLRFIKKYT